MRHDDIVIVSAKRTPIGKWHGMLRDIPASRLGGLVAREAIAEAGLAPSQIDEAIFGQALQAGCGQNPARQAAFLAGMANETTAYTINHVCGSGLKSIHLACQSVKEREEAIVVCGGMENMSLAPYSMPGARYGYRSGHREVLDLVFHDGLSCAITQVAMGETAERLCDRYGFTREALDTYAAESQRRAGAAQAEGRFLDETVRVPLRQGGAEPAYADRDEFVKPDTTAAALSKLRPAFRDSGRITAGNASGINDGAAALVVTSARCAAKYGLSPLAIVRANAVAGVDPGFMGIGPVPAVRKALTAAGLSVRDIGLIELNEAFAAQAMAVIGELGLDPANVNPNGGAIALGHPIGASGARITVSLLYEMRRRQARYGLAALCIGGGQGIATILENVS